MSELPEINRMESNKENLQSISSVDSAREHCKLECDSNSQDEYKSEGDLRTLTGLKVRPGEREDNKWLQYSADNKPLDQVYYFSVTTSYNSPLLKVSYDEPRYLNKAYLGFYTWPDEPIVYAPGSQQPKLDRSEEVMIADEDQG